MARRRRFSVRALLAALLTAGLTLGAGCTTLAQAGCARDQFILALDIGHTPKRPGAISASGVPEYAFNERLAKELRDALVAAGFRQTLLVNEGAQSISLNDRTILAGEAGADLFLSVHHDSVQPHFLKTWNVGGSEQRYSDKYAGFSLFVSRRNRFPGASEAFAVTLGEALLRQGLQPTLHHAEPIKGENRTLLDEDRGVYQFDDLIVLHSATMPAVLLEAGVIVNREEEQRLNSPEYRARIAEAVVAVTDVVCSSR